MQSNHNPPGHFGTFYAYENNTHEHYATQHTFTLSDNIADMGTFIAKQTYWQKWPAIFPQFLQDKLTRSAQKAYKENPAAKPGETLHDIHESHGTQHASRVATYAEALLNLYKRFGNVGRDNENMHAEYDYLLNLLPERGTAEASLKKNDFLTLLKIAVFYHDTGRYGEGNDRRKWEIMGAHDCYVFIKKLLNNTYPNQPIEGLHNSIALIFSHAIVDKDINPKKRNKNILARILGDADSLDIMRCSTAKDMRRNFFSRYPLRTRRYQLQYLNFWQDCMGEYDPVDTSFIPAAHRAEAQEELVRVALAVRNYIKSSSDLSSPAPIEVILPIGRQKQLFTISSGVNPSYSLRKKRVHEAKGLHNINDSIPMSSPLADYLGDEAQHLPAPVANRVQVHGHDLLFKLAFIELIEATKFRYPSELAAITKAANDLKAALVYDDSASADMNKKHRLAAIDTYLKVTAKYHQNGHFSALKNALLLLAITALSVVVGIAIAVAAISIGTAIAGPAGAAVGLVAGVIYGAAAGAALGATLGGYKVGLKFFNSRHNWQNDAITRVADTARTMVKSP